VTGPLSIDGLADDLAALLDALGIESARVVGSLAWHPGGALVRGPVLGQGQRVGSAGCGSSAGPAGQEATRARAAAVREQGMAAVASTIVANATSEATRRDRPEVAAFVRELLMRQDPEGYARSCEALAAATDPARGAPRGCAGCCCRSRSLSRVGPVLGWPAGWACRPAPTLSTTTSACAVACTTATVDQLLDRRQGGKSTVSGYREYVDKHVRPSLASARRATSAPISLTRSMPSSGAVVSTVRAGGRLTTGRLRSMSAISVCRPHRCKPLGNATIRKIHYILSDAYKRAVRWLLGHDEPDGPGRASAPRDSPFPDCTRR
jgi:hypothetical protein